MARVITSIKNALDELFHGYDPGKHYMRGPGPKTAEAQRKQRSSLQKQDNGGGSRLVVATSDMTRVSPDARRA